MRGVFVVGSCASAFVWLWIACVLCAVAPTARRAGRSRSFVLRHSPPSNWLRANQFERKLARALDQLPDRLRLVMLLTALEGNTVDEAGAHCSAFQLAP